MQHLPTKEVLSLKNIISVYKECRADFYDATIMPIGQTPDGISFTGFNVIVGKGEGYLLLFRELGEQAEFVFDIKEVGTRSNYEILASNDDSAELLFLAERKLKTTFTKQGAYAFIRYF